MSFASHRSWLRLQSNVGKPRRNFIHFGKPCRNFTYFGRPRRSSSCPGRLLQPLATTQLACVERWSGALGGVWCFAGNTIPSTDEGNQNQFAKQIDQPQ